MFLETFKSFTNKVNFYLWGAGYLPRRYMTLTEYLKYFLNNLKGENRG